MLALMLSALFAQAGEIQVITSNPVMVVVNGQILEYPEGSTSVTASGLSEGYHLVEIKTLFGKDILDYEVAVGATEQVRFKYKKKVLTELGRGQMAPTQVVAVTQTPAPAPAPVATTTETVSVGLTTSANSASVQAGASSTTSETVSVGIGGLSASVTISESSSANSSNMSVSSSHASSHATTQAVATTQVQQVPPAPVAISSSDLSSLLRRIDAESFSDDKLDLISNAARYHHFECHQVTQVLSALTFSEDQVEAARRLQPKVIDPQNAYMLNDALKFSSDKQEVQALFR